MMKISRAGGTLTVRVPERLCAENAEVFKGEVLNNLNAGKPVTTVEFLMDETLSVDAFGLGSLMKILRVAQGKTAGARIRMLNTLPAVLKIFELTRMNRLFEIVRTPKAPDK